MVLFALLAGLFGSSSPDTLERVRERGYFTWGADEEGGGPYVFPDPTAPERRTGFEVDLAEAIAAELSRSLQRPIEARFAQSPWDKLPDLLKTERIDLVMNGYEWTPERALDMASTLPYYVYELQLLALDDGPNGLSWDALRVAPPKKVGILGGSAAERYLTEQYSNVEIVSYDGNTNAMNDVVNRRLDATLQDLPIALFYAKDFPSLRFVGDPVGAGRYVIFVRRHDDALRNALNLAIVTLRDRGELKAIYERYGIWTRAQTDPVLTSLPEGEATTKASHRSAAVAFFEKHALTLLQSAGVTLLLSVLSMPLAIAVGMLVALGRMYGPRALALPLSIYVEVLRGTPLMLQLFVVFYVLPNIGIRLDALTASVLGLAINYSAYEAEIYRAGLQAVPVGQMEAALALGMSRRLALRRIIVPQAALTVIPAVTNDFIALFKDTSVCSVITVVELTKRYNIAAMTNPAEVLPLAVVAGLLYLAMSYPLSVFSAFMERKLRK